MLQILKMKLGKAGFLFPDYAEHENSTWACLLRKSSTGELWKCAEKPKEIHLVLAMATMTEDLSRSDVEPEMKMLGADDAGEQNAEASDEVENLRNRYYSLRMYSIESNAILYKLLSKWANIKIFFCFISQYYPLLFWDQNNLCEPEDVA